MLSPCRPLLPVHTSPIHVFLERFVSLSHISIVRIQDHSLCWLHPFFQDSYQNQMYTALNVIFFFQVFFLFLGQLHSMITNIIKSVFLFVQTMCAPDRITPMCFYQQNRTSLSSGTLGNNRFTVSLANKGMLTLEQLEYLIIYRLSAFLFCFKRNVLMTSAYS